MSPVPAIGIHLSGTSSCVGVYENGQVRIIPDDEGNRTMPSYVVFTDKWRLVGVAAKNIAHIDPANTVFDVMRLIGRRFDESCVQEDAKRWPFKVVDQGGMAAIELDIEHEGKKRRFYPEEISAMILENLKEQVERYLGQKVKEAVITVPAYFNDSQRQATKDAGKIAGLNVLRILNEPTAAAIAYGPLLEAEFLPKCNVLVYDLGGGAFNVSVLTVEGSDCPIEIQAIGGHSYLGGDAFDSLLVDRLVGVLEQKHNKDATKDWRAKCLLRKVCERAKRTLSKSNDITIEVDSLFRNFNLSETVTRAEFERLCLPLFQLTINIVEETLKSIKLKKEQIDKIILVGGSSRIPKVQAMLKEFFKGKELLREILQEEASVHGAAILAAEFSKEIPRASPKLNDPLNEDAAMAKARNELEKYVYLLKSQWDKTPLSRSQHKIIEKQITEAEEWISKRLNSSSKSDVEARLDQLRSTCKPIVGNLEFETTI